MRNNPSNAIFIPFNPLKRIATNPIIKRKTPPIIKTLPIAKCDKKIIQIYSERYLFKFLKNSSKNSFPFSTLSFSILA